MEVTTGTVVDGKVVVDGRPLREGTTVTIVVDEDNRECLTASQQASLLRSVKQAEQGRVVDGWALLREIKTKR